MTAPVKRAWWKRTLKALLFVFIIVVTLLVLAASWISLQGRREWDATKKELIARGEKLSMIELAPPPVPDAENFFADPMWTEMETRVSFNPDGSQHSEWRVPPAKWQFDLLHLKPTAEEMAALKQRFPAFVKVAFETNRVEIARREGNRVSKSGSEAERKELPAFTLAVLEPLAPLMAKVNDLLQRPKARMSTDYAAGFYAALQHLHPLLRLGQAYQFRAAAEIQLQQKQAAFRDILTTIELSRTLTTEPLLISQFVRYSLLSLAICSPMEAGIRAHVWTDADLVAFEQQLKNENIITGLALGFRGERGSFNQTMEAIQGNNKVAYEVIRMMYGMSDKPVREKTWWQRNLGMLPLPTSSWQRNLGELVIGPYFTIFGPGDQSFYNHRLQQEIEEIEQTKSVGFSPDRTTGSFQTFPRDVGFEFFHLLSSLAGSGLSSSIKRAASVQDIIIQARLVCALERYYLAHKEYPTSLNALVPGYFASLPVDVVTLQPMHYERTASDKFRLWAIGWDSKDDGGRTSVTSDSNDGDWTWGNWLWW